MSAMVHKAGTALQTGATASPVENTYTQTATRSAAGELKILHDENGEDLFITLDDEDEFEKVAAYFDELFDSEIDYDA